MSERDKAVLSSWAIGALTAIALALSGWCLSRTVALGEEAAGTRERCNAFEKRIDSMDAKLDELLRRVPPKGA